MDGVQVEYEYAAPLELLWRALTERAKIAGWWGENDFVPRAGQRFTVSAIGLAALPGPVECTITELDPEHRLVMGWRVGITRATVSLLAEATESGSRLIVTRHGAVGPVTPVDLDQALHNLFDVRLRLVLSRVQVGVGPASGSDPVVGPGSPVAPGRSGPVLRRPRLGRRGVRPGGPPRPVPIWPAFSVVVVIAVIVIAVLVGSLGADGSSTGSALGPVQPPSAVPGSGAAAPAGDGSGAAGPGAGGNGQPGQPNQPPGATVPTAAAGPNAPPLSAHMTASFRVVAQRPTSFDVAVTVANSGGASGRWTSVAAALTGLNLKIDVLGSTVSYVLRHGTNCFVPTASIATVAPNASVTFTFTVGVLSGLLGTIDSVALDSPSCA